MDGIEHVALAFDFAFGVVAGFGGDEFAEAFVTCRNDALEAVGHGRA